MAIVSGGPEDAEKLTKSVDDTGLLHNTMSVQAAIIVPRDLQSEALGCAFEEWVIICEDKFIHKKRGAKHQNTLSEAILTGEKKLGLQEEDCSIRSKSQLTETTDEVSQSTSSTKGEISNLHFDLERLKSVSLSSSAGSIDFQKHNLASY
jgi:hypothetical protein